MTQNNTAKAEFEDPVQTIAQDDDNGIGIRGLNDKQLLALPLLVSGMAPKDAAQAAGVSWGTLRHWISDNSTFKGALARLRREAHHHAVASIHALSSDATAALREILHDPTASTRDKLTAASTVLRHVMPTQSNHTLTTPEDAASAIAAILDQLEDDHDGQDYP